MNKVLDFPAPDKTAKGNPIIEEWEGKRIDAMNPRHLMMVISDAVSDILALRAALNIQTAATSAWILQASREARSAARKVWIAYGIGLAHGAGAVIAALMIWGV